VLELHVVHEMTYYVSCATLNPTQSHSDVRDAGLHGYSDTDRLGTWNSLLDPARDPNAIYRSAFRRLL